MKAIQQSESAEMRRAESLTPSLTEQVLEPTEEALTVCPNCGCPEVQAFCPRCGQEDGPLIPSVREVVLEFVTSILSFDSKLFVTLRGLFRPGFLTQEFFAGRRARYFGPIRLFLWVSAIILLITAFFPHPDINFDVSPFLPNTPSAATAPAKTTGTGAGSRLPTNTVPASSGRAQTANQRLKALTRWTQEHPEVWNFLYLPLYAGGLYLLYGRRRRYIEHLVFLLHYQTFSAIISLPQTIFFLTQGALVLSSGTVVENNPSHTPWLSALMRILIGMTVFVLDFTYLMRAIRTVYGESTPTALWKAALIFFGMMVLNVGIIYGLLYLLLLF